MRGLVIVLRSWKNWFSAPRTPITRPQTRPATRYRGTFEALEDRSLLSVTTAPAATGYQTQTPVSPAPISPQAQYITHGSYQTVSSLTVDLTADPNKTGLFDVSFQAQVKSNSATDQVLVRLLVDNNPDPIAIAIGHDAIENLAQNNYGNWGNLSLTQQLSLTPGTLHTIKVQVQDTATAGGGQPDLIVWNPTLQATGYNKLDNINAAVGYSTTQVATQAIAAGNYQTVGSLTVNVTTGQTGQYDLGFLAQVLSNSNNNQVQVRYLIDGNTDPNDLATKQGGADLVENLIKPAGLANWGTLSLTHQLTLGVGTHTIEVQVLGTTAAAGANGQDVLVKGSNLHLTSYNTIGGQQAATGYQTQTVSNPAGSTSQNVTAGSYQTVSTSQSLTLSTAGLYNLSFQAQVLSNSTNDQVLVRYLIDGRPDPNDLAVGQFTGADLIANLTQSGFGNGSALSLYHQLTLTAGTHVITVQVLGKATAGAGKADLVVSNPVLQLVAENSLVGGANVTAAYTMVNTQSISGLVITPSTLSPGVTNFQITNVTGGLLYLNNGATLITNGMFITLAQAAAGLKFTPTKDSLATGTFVIQQSTTNTIAGLVGNQVSATITISLGVPTVTTATTVINLQTTSGLVLTADPASTTAAYFQITAITGGTLYQNDGTTQIRSGDFITLAQGAAGLKFTPLKDSLLGGSFVLQQATRASTANLIGTRVTGTITISADNPTVTGATTLINQQSQAGLIITPSTLDPRITYFQITAVSGGRLYLNDGVTQLNNNAFITLAQGRLGLKFTPNTGSLITGGFLVQQATANNTNSLLGGKVAANITITADNPTVTNAATTQNVQTSSGLVILPNPQDTAVQNFQITAITGGTLYLNDGVTQVTSGTLITLAQAAAGLKFTPTRNSLVTGSFGVQQYAPTGLVGGRLTATISVVPELPTVTSTSTTQNIQTSTGLFIAPNSLDPTIAYFQITTILGGTLYQHDGTTQIRSGDFITLAQGAAGLKFTPTKDSLLNGSFVVQQSTLSSTNGLQGSKVTATITVLADLPTVTGAATVQNVQTTSGLIINANPLDPNVAYFQITSITGGTLYQNNGTTPITNNTFITLAQAKLGLKFTPALNSLVNGNFTIQQATSATVAGLVGGKVAATITVSANGPSTLNASTIQNVQTTSGLVLNPNPLDLSVKYFQISGISGGTLYQNDGTTVIKTGAFITVAQGQAGLKFTPAKNSLATGTFVVQQVTGNGPIVGSGAISTAAIAVSPELPTVTNTTTAENVQSQSGLVLTRNPLDPAVGYYQITAITGGKLFQHDGTTPIASGSFITVAQGNLGLKFTPTLNSLATGSFVIQQAIMPTATGLEGSTVTATITVVPDVPTVTNATAVMNGQSTSGLVITANPYDPRVTYFQITGITGGVLYLNDGVTRVVNGATISVAQAALGLKFSPSPNSTATGSFTIQQSATAGVTNLIGDKVTATITVTTS